MITRGRNDELKAVFEKGTAGQIVEFDLENIENSVKTTLRCRIIHDPEEPHNRPYVPIQQISLDRIDAVKDEALRILKIKFLDTMDH